VTISYGHGPVLDGVSLRVGRGEFVALVGPNGSGKSTLLRVLLGLLTPERGEVSLLGGPPGALRDPGRLGYVPQRGRFEADLPATVAEVVATGRLARHGWWRGPRAEDRRAVTHAIDAVALGPFRDRRVGELSGGQQQRVMIAKALASDPELLVLDEPVAGVDAESQRSFRDSLVHLIEAHDGAVLLVSHELGAVADDLDRVVVLKQRVIFDGSPADLRARGVSLGVHAEDLPLWLEGLE
jgi:zinc transport system ATP-binding protein